MDSLTPNLEESNALIEAREKKRALSPTGATGSRGSGSAATGTNASGTAGTANRAEESYRRAAFNPGAGAVMRQGTIDTRRSARPIGTPGYPPAAWQVGTDVSSGWHSLGKDLGKWVPVGEGDEARQVNPAGAWTPLTGSPEFSSQRDRQSPSDARVALLREAGQPVDPTIGQGVMAGAWERYWDNVYRGGGGLRRSGPMQRPAAPFPVMGGTRAMVSNPELGGLGVPNTIYSFPETPVTAPRMTTNKPGDAWLMRALTGRPVAPAIMTPKAPKKKRSFWSSLGIGK